MKGHTRTAEDIKSNQPNNHNNTQIPSKFNTVTHLKTLGLQLGDVPEQTRVVGLHLRNLLGLGRLLLVLRGGLFQ